jgi:hypothetical protein
MNTKRINAKLSSITTGIRFWLIKKIAGNSIIMMNCKISGKDGLQIKQLDKALIANNIFTDFNNQAVKVVDREES